MAAEFRIRAGQPKDHEQWLALWVGYNAHYGRSGPTALAPDITATTWARLFDASEPMHLLVAEAEDRLIGLTHFIFHRSTTSVAPSVYLQDLFVSEDARGRGVGRGLIEQVYQLADAAGSSRVYWLTHQSNDVAMRLYNQVAKRSEFVLYQR